MSLLDNAMEQCVLLDRHTGNDGYGGITSSWVDGASFDAAITLDTSTIARIGGAQGVTNLYTVTARKSTVLEFHDVFRRASDQKVFRVTSDGTDKKTPNSASINMRQVTAEEWSIPTYGQPAGS